jgi:RimJ/RimL family protein N-acetyltransferase
MRPAGERPSSHRDATGPGGRYGGRVDPLRRGETDDTFDTARLRIRPLAPGDLDVIVRIHTDPALMRHIHRGVPHTADECVVDLARALAHWRDHRCGTFVVTTPGSDSVRTKPGGARTRGTAWPEGAEQLVGTVGFTTPEWLPEVMPARDVGWTIVQEHQGHGYATEAARAAVDWYFATSHDDRVVGIHNSDNPRSGAVMQRLGMRWSRRTRHPALGYPLEIWETTRAEW